LETPYRRNEQLKIRNKEVSELIDSISEPGFLQKQFKFPEGIDLDLDKIVCCGHSFGGITAITTAALDDRIKCAMALDPWFLPISMEGTHSKYFLSKTPVLCLRSESYNFYQ